MVAEVKIDRTSTFGKLHTAVAVCAYLVNCRPLQLNLGASGDGFICPNDLIMGRSGWFASYYQRLVK